MRGQWTTDLALLAAACGPRVEPTVSIQSAGAESQGEGVSEVENAVATPTPAEAAHRVALSVDDVDSTPTELGAHSVHFIDVGTGRSVLVQGGDSRRDFRGVLGSANNSRQLAYLWEAIGPSGPVGCQLGSASNDAIADPDLTIEARHPHQDHGVVVVDVLRGHAVEQVYDSGAVNDTLFYVHFVETASGEPGVTYRTALTPTGNRTVYVSGKTHTIRGPWMQFIESVDAHAVLGKERRSEFSARMASRTTIQTKRQGVLFRGGHGLRSTESMSRAKVLM